MSQSNFGMFQMNKTAVLSECQRYRYELRRVWDPDLPVVNFVGLNPSKADDKIDDATITRCIGFAQRWGMGGLIMTNLFAWRATDPEEMWRQPERCGLRSNDHLILAAREAHRIVIAWGNLPPAGVPRMLEVLSLLAEFDLQCFGKTGLGYPLHPVRLGYSVKPRPWKE